MWNKLAAFIILIWGAEAIIKKRAYTFEGPDLFGQRAIEYGWLLIIFAFVLLWPDISQIFKNRK